MKSASRVLVLASVLITTANTIGQGQNRTQAQAEESVRLLVARIEGAQVGAGIIVGASRGRLIIATAAHVLGSSQDPAANVKVWFHWEKETLVPASVLSRDPDLDLAFLEVSTKSAGALNLEGLPLDLMGRPATMKRGADVRLLGHPSGEQWYMRFVPDKVTVVSETSIRFDSASVSAGSSGGALLDTDFRVVGMVVGEQGRQIGLAIPIAHVLERMPNVPDLTLLGQRQEVKFRAVTAGKEQTCAISTNDTLYCWGYNRHKTMAQLEEPEIDTVALNVASASAGASHVCGISNDGAAFCWGHKSAALGQKDARDGTVVAVGGAPALISITAADQHTCGILKSGGAVCWGRNREGQLGDGTKTDRPTPVLVAANHVFTALSAGYGSTCGATAANELVCWGVEWELRPVVVATLPEQITSLSVGLIKGCLTTASGATLCWGNSEFGETGRAIDNSVIGHSGIGLRRVAEKHKLQAVGLWDNHACGVDVAGAGWCWGYNKFGRLGDGSEKNSTQPRRVALQTKLVAIAVGQDHSCGLDSSGDLYCWGNRNAGALGPAENKGKGLPGRVRITPRK